MNHSLTAPRMSTRRNLVALQIQVKRRRAIVRPGTPVFGEGEAIFGEGSEQIHG